MAGDGGRGGGDHEGAQCTVQKCSSTAAHLSFGVHHADLEVVTQKQRAAAPKPSKGEGLEGPAEESELGVRSCGRGGHEDCHIRDHLTRHRRAIGLAIGGRVNPVALTRAVHFPTEDTTLPIVTTQGRR